MQKKQFFLVLSGFVTNEDYQDAEGTIDDSELDNNLKSIIDIAVGEGLITNDLLADLGEYKTLIEVADDESEKHAYNHAYDIGFEVCSADKDAEDVTPQMLRAALIKRILSMSDTEIGEACGAPFDTFEIIIK